jgi:hypothetical protein
MIASFYPWRRFFAGSRLHRLLALVCVLLTLWAALDGPILLTFAPAAIPASTPQTPMPQGKDDDILPPVVSLFPGGIRSAAPAWNDSPSAIACTTAAPAFLFSLGEPSNYKAFCFDRQNGFGAVLRC